MFKLKDEGLRIRVSIVYRSSDSLILPLLCGLCVLGGKLSRVAVASRTRYNRPEQGRGELLARFASVQSHSTKDVSNFSHARIAVTPFGDHRALAWPHDGRVGPAGSTNAGDVALGNISSTDRGGRGIVGGVRGMHCGHVLHWDEPMVQGSR